MTRFTHRNDRERVVTLTLTAAQIRALNTRPVQAIPAPGRGRFVQPLSWCVALRAGDTPYAEENNTIALAFSGSPDDLQADTDNLLDATEDTQISGPIETRASAEDQALLITAPADPAGGDGTATVRIVYTIGRT